jgi:hypothetical protein
MDRIQAVFIEQDDEEHAPPARLLKVSFFSGGHTPSGEPMDAIVYFAIGDYDESTHGFGFTSDPERSFSVEHNDLIRALGALGVILIDTFPDDE